MSIKITAPYNFVPLNKDVFYPSWSEQVSQDLPFSDSEDGIIDVALHTVSPFFSRDGKDKEYSSHIMDSDGKRHYFIPATTIKGMLREMIEIMSFGKMQEGKDYQNRYFGWRQVAKGEDKTKYEEYHRLIEAGKPGWLKKEGDYYTFTPCLGKLEKIQISDVVTRFPGYTPSSSVWDVNSSVERKGFGPSYPEVEIDGESYRLVCTGNIEKKGHELLFPSETDFPIEICEDTIGAFKNVYVNTPGFAEKTPQGTGCYLEALEAGHEIPVFKIVRDGKTILGMSKMFRVPYNNDVKQQVEYIQKADSNKADLAETMFGYVGKEKSLKGRVMVGHAFMDGVVEDNQLIPISGILGTPKASYSHFYIKQQHSPYKTYDDKNGIAGRKLYRIHRGNSVSDLPPIGENKNIISTFKPLPKGHVFHLRISLHNVRPMEVGAILTAMTLNGTEGTFFSLGLAKGFGYGKCKINMEDIKLSGFSKEAKYYMHEFEKQMSIFTYGRTHQLWASTESITQLVNILSEHDDETVKMMILEEYTASKKEDNPFSVLEESGKTIQSLLSAEERENIKTLAKEARERDEQLARVFIERETAANARKELELSYQEAEHHLANAEQLSASAKDSISDISKVIEELREASKIYNEITDSLLAKHVSMDDEKAKIASIEAKIAQCESEMARIQQSQAAQKKEAKMQAGLSAELDKLAGDGKSYSVKEFKVYFQRIKKWNKAKNQDKLSSEDIPAAEATAKRLLTSPDKKDVRDLKDFSKGKHWKDLTACLGEDAAKALCEYYKSVSNV